MHHLRQCTIDDDQRLAEDTVVIDESVDHLDGGDVLVSHRFSPYPAFPGRARTYDGDVDVVGKHIVMTGAAGGIGSAIARSLHAAGANVVVSDLDGADDVAADLPGAFSVAADISTEPGNIALIDAAESHFGPIDLFFANAGVGTGQDPMSDESLWNLSFDVNFHAHRWAARRLLPGWLDRGEGYFCSTASAAGLLAQIGSAPYSVTKHAAVGFAEWLSITYGDRGLKVSCLCPQGVNTNMVKVADDQFASGSVVRQVAAILEPEEVAEMVLEAIGDERFLILPHAEVSDYMALRGADHGRWLGGMRKLNRRITGV